MESDPKGKKEPPDIFFLKKYIQALDLCFRECREEYKLKFQIPVEYAVLKATDDFRGTD